MNELQKPLLDKPSIGGNYCAICHRPANNHHHVIQKGCGGLPKRVERRIPTIILCGDGNMSGCHKDAHDHRLHFRWRDGWEYLRTDAPTKYQDALEMDGWKRLRPVAEFDVIGGKK